MVAAENVLKLFVRDGAAMKDCQGREVIARDRVRVRETKTETKRGNIARNPSF